MTIVISVVFLSVCVRHLNDIQVKINSVMENRDASCLIRNHMVYVAECICLYKQLLMVRCCDTCAV